MPAERSRSPTGLVVLVAVLALAAATAIALSERTGVRAERWQATLTGAQEVPPNGSLAIGRAEIRLEADRLRIRLSWRGLSGPVTGAHLHGPAAAGTEGPVVFDLVPGRFPEGTPGPVESEFGISQVERRLLRGGRMYANVHTRTYPRGEIRGATIREREE